MSPPETFQTVESRARGETSGAYTQYMSTANPDVQRPHSVTDEGCIRLDGRLVAQNLSFRIATSVTSFREATGFPPGLAVVMIGEDPASTIYIQRKHETCKHLGMNSWVHHLPKGAPSDHVLSLIQTLNEAPEINGILVQLPLPKHLDEKMILQTIHPSKDVDSLHPCNLGKLLTQESQLIPCTPQGCLRILDHYAIPLAGKHALMIGRSRIVGLPMSILLTHRHCTVTIAHSHTEDLPALCARADIVVAALGRPAYIKGEWLKPKATVLDVGLTRLHHADGPPHLCGDVDTAAVEHVAAITPVPGGVGPMTVMCLMANTVIAAHLQQGTPVPSALAR